MRKDAYTGDRILSPILQVLAVLFAVCIWLPVSVILGLAKRY